MRPFIIVMLFCVAVLPTIKSATNQSAMRPLGYTFLAGRPGIPGLHGKPGAPGTPGAPGRDGREGIQGKRGPRGFQGSPGAQGPPGSTGSNGKPGARGPHGPRGLKGDRGPKGLSFRSNWKECVWKPMNDGKDNGHLKDCVFKKRYSHTSLYVYWNGDFRVAYCTGCCKRWFFTFNGAECKSPAPIDGVQLIHSGVSRTYNVHFVKTIQGHCNKIQNGRIRVGFNVGNCKGYGNADAYTAYRSISRVYIEEVPRPQP